MRFKTPLTKLKDFYHANGRPDNLGEFLGWMADICLRHVHGVNDNDIYKSGRLMVDNSSFRLKGLQAGYGFTNCNCRYIAYALLNLLDTVDIPARKIELISGLHKSRDTRHTVVEASFEGKYIHVDVDMGLLFSPGKGNHGEYWSSRDLQQVFNEGRVAAENIVRLIKPGSKMIDNSSHEYLKAILADDGQLIGWYSGLGNAMMVGTDIYTADDSNENLERIRGDLADSIRGQEHFLPLAEFTSKYY